ncbi:MAG: CDP-diacylglycerol--glycerol-3-phosphate 3-phosphatidyltransferase [Lachnospiraceae bacterium]|nr:CDP-diacylglycerol--glycerol-3-phosphate 3-phosphatidyltransferase [Lachnospiraceae bacterium]
MNVPNFLTLLRVFMVPVFVVFMLADILGEADRYVAGALFIAASLTDTLDGYLARKNNQITVFGKFMDPLADKLLVCAAMICLVELGQLPGWIVIIIVSREFIISGFRLIAAERGVVIAASYWGKFKTVSQMVMVILLVFDFGGVFDILEQIFIYLALALTLISLADYIYKNIGILKEVH